MGYTIAIAGKGGTGKTTLAALIVRVIREKKLGSVLAVDADPNSNLAEALGIEIKETIGSILEEISLHPEKIPSGMPKDRFMEYRLQTAIAEGNGFDILVMGRPEGPGCYCYVNNVLRNIMSKLVKDYDYIVIDNEAGLEHLSRRTSRDAQALLVISDATKVGLKSAKRINELANELGVKIKKRLLIINQHDQEVNKEVIKDSGLEYIGNIPLDNNITKVSLNGNSLLGLDNDSPGLKTLREIGDKIWQEN
ncbi:MAG: AAA family ATPase [Candidatus Omnitrophica bacterium]|nr:AAA family ATPase [Candidatus Omnitrophota bacterium]MBU4472582.1 AAA family ATPase [Candidatus Omnitrophota bacterium]MCG2705950.1 AAA family ATPase [Candidatus Omnitrophota bacterium]